METPHGEDQRDRPPGRSDGPGEPEDGPAAQANDATTDDPGADGASPEPADRVSEARANGSMLLVPIAPPSPTIAIEEVLRRDTTAKPPLLASEALMDDLAPVQPARAAARVWCAAVGLGFVFLGFLSLGGLRPGGAAAGLPAFLLGAVALFAALTRVTYRQRAFAMVVLGVLASVIGLNDAEPRAGVATGGVGWGIARSIATAALPAALVFRSRYRAYAGARWLLVAAFVIALPSLGHALARLILVDLHISHIGALAVCLAVLASLTGFMGAETTGAGAFLAVAVVLAFTGDLLIAGFAQLDSLTLGGIVGTIASALAFAATSAITSLGLFQILAWRLAADARRIDLHSRPKEAAKRQQSGGEWLT
jgi:hypothetical protein